MLGVKRSPFPLGVSASPVERRNTDSRNGSKQSGKTHFSGSKRKHRVDMTFNELEGRDEYRATLSAYEKSGHSTKITYYELQQNTLQESIAIQGLLQMNANKIVLLHVDSHLDGIHWFWTIVA